MGVKWNCGQCHREFDFADAKIKTRKYGNTTLTDKICPFCGSRIISAKGLLNSDEHIDKEVYSNELYDKKGRTIDLDYFSIELQH